MSEYTIKRFDPDPEKRTWQGGNFSVKRDGVTVALFIFDYPENSEKLYGDEATALAAAKSFMAIDDLARIASRLIKLDGAEGLSSAALSLFIDWSNEALEKAGIK